MNSLCKNKIKFKKIIKFNFSNKNNMIGKLKHFGKFGLIFYSCYVFIGFAGFYILLEYKYIDMNKIIIWIEEKGFNKYIDLRKHLNKTNPNLVSFIGAYLLNQLFEIIRLPTTIIILTYIFRKRK